MENLKQDAEYVIRVAAVTESGSGKLTNEMPGPTYVVDSILILI